VARDLAIDLGTANTLVYERGRGIVLNEPTVIALNERTQEVLAMGHEAWQMIGRTPGYIVAVRPLRQGAITDFEITQRMIRLLLHRVGVNRFNRPRVVICVPSAITEVERRAVTEAARRAGAADAQLIEQEGLGHAYRHDALDWPAFLRERARDPFPPRLRWRSAWKDPERVGWARIEAYEKEVQEIFELRVDGASWDSWDHERRVRHVLELADARTAELLVERGEGGEGGALRVTGAGVREAALLLPADWLAAQPEIRLEAGGKTKTLKPKPSAKVLLLDFAERFDRTFLPVAELRADL
jgi:hypothetical protein